MVTTYEAIYEQDGCNLDYTPIAAVNAGDVVQWLDGRAAYSPKPIAAGVAGAVRDSGLCKVAKKTGVVVLAGAPLYWDHSANEATPVPPMGASADDKDFFIGSATADAVASASVCYLRLNVRPAYLVDFLRDGGDTVPVLTSGAPYIYNRGASLEMGFSATAEAQKLDWLSKRSFPVGADWIFEGIVEVKTNADADVADLSIGVANATHASDADSITESALIHLDMGGDLNIYAESDDGTTEVAATDTTIDWAVGTPFHVVIDGRDESDLQIYINGVNVLPATVFDISAATGPLKLLLHLEKSANDSPGAVMIDCAKIRRADL